MGVFPGTPLDNWMSANVTDICPTGALTPREFRFESRVWNLDSTESVCNGCDVGCNIFIGHRSGQVFRYRPRVNPEVNDHWLCDYGRFSYEQYETDRVVVPKVRTEDDYLGHLHLERSAGSRSRTRLRGREEDRHDRLRADDERRSVAGARALRRRSCDATIGVMVDPIGPIKMKSRTEWLLGEQAGAELPRRAGRGRRASIDELLTNGADGIDVLYITRRRVSASGPKIRPSWPTCARPSSSSSTRGTPTIR